MIAGALAGLVAGLTGLFGVAAGYRLWRAGPGGGTPRPVDAAAVARQADRADPPRYAVLLPLRDEPRMVAPLLDALDRLRYPRTHLDVVLLIDADDGATAEAARAALAAGDRAHVRVERVPCDGLATKPRACRHGLEMVDAEMVCVLDAEDRPHPDLLLAVLAARASDPEAAVVQGVLAMDDRVGGIIPAFMAAEYRLWFGRVLPGLAGAGLLTPLGGTSNHLPVAALRDAGGWDPRHLTEDADLAARLARAGRRTLVLDCPTLEEPPRRLRDWMRQRSRWSSGYLSTWRAAAAAGGLGPRRAAHMHLTLGGTVVLQLCVPLVAAAAAAAPLVRTLPIPRPLELALRGAAVAWVAGAGAYTALMARQLSARRRRAALLPLYWLAEGLAGWRGAIRLVTHPGRWEKTPHGWSLDRDAGRRAPA